MCVRESDAPLRWIRVFAHLSEEYGTPERIIIDNRPEFTSKAVDTWAYTHKVDLAFIRPVKPMDNGYIERFNGKFRDECLNGHWFISLADARQIIKAWRNDYNQARPHQAFGQLTPPDFAKRNIIFDPISLIAIR